MAGIEMSENGFVIDAEILADAFRMNATDVRSLLRSGEITSRCERGVDEDAGRWRLVFFHGGRTLRLTVDGSGRILSRVAFAAPPRRGQGNA